MGPLFPCHGPWECGVKRDTGPTTQAARSLRALLLPLAELRRLFQAADANAASTRDAAEERDRASTYSKCV